MPEIYPHCLLAGVALEFDDAGKQAGLAAAKATSTAQFDADRVAVLDFLAERADPLFATGFCLGGHLAFRAGGSTRGVAATRFYPTGLHDGALGADADAGSLARAADIHGRLLLVFGSRDPHVPAARGSRSCPRCTPRACGSWSCTSTPAASTPSCATSAPATTRC